MSQVTFSEAGLRRHNTQRRRALRPNLWKDEVRKWSKARGVQFVSRSGTVHPAINLPQNGKICGARCTKPGCILLGQQEKQEIFQQFRTKDSNAQNAIVAGLVDIRVPKEVRVQNSRKRHTFAYIVSHLGARKKVCRLTFLDVFRITLDRMRSIVFPAWIRVTHFLHFSFNNQIELVTGKADFRAASLISNVPITTEPNFLQQILPKNNGMRLLEQGKVRDLGKLSKFLSGHATAWYDTVVEEHRLAGVI